jgi:hypothetical protein
MAMGQRYLVLRLLFVVVLREQRAALRGIQLEAKCKTTIKMSKALDKIGLRFPYRLFGIKRKLKSTPQLPTLLYNYNFIITAVERNPKVQCALKYTFLRCQRKRGLRINHAHDPIAVFHGLREHHLDLPCEDHVRQTESGV